MQNPTFAPVSPFQSAWFLSAFLEASPPDAGHKIIVHTLRDPQTLEILVALPVMQTRSYGVRRIQAPGSSYCDITAPVLSERFLALPPATRSQSLERLLSQIHDGDYIRLPNVTATVNGQPNPLFDQVSRARQQAAQYSMYLPDSAPDRRPSRSAYKEYEGKYRKLEQKGYTFREVEGAEPRLAAIDTLLRLRAESFAARGMAQPDATAASALYRALVRRPDAVNRLHVLVLADAGGDIVAGAALIGGKTCLNGTLLGISGPEWRRLSPGMVLIMKIQDWARDRGFTHLNFGAGDQSYKEKFGAHAVPAGEIVRARTVVGRLHLYACDLRRQVAGLGQRLRSGPGLLPGMRTTALAAATQVETAGIAALL
ncbi:GNAT family N-acetyltransferase [Microvirga tunisiensis]|uniref:GNAT family N-acetyltransferase n=1 Tax=Pannonibacter tanglangensis TaxID=2750084 RepID=A0A7X5F1Y7_9HYPH|nr:GNAT family N-acetyltransferase [Pannonibacter sp. XCT-53]NBN76989.1 GNAT family N-acetyltransferase [Pannonibacter sp. XCT-53]